MSKKVPFLGGFLLVGNRFPGAIFTNFIIWGDIIIVCDMNH